MNFRVFNFIILYVFYCHTVLAIDPVYDGKNGIRTAGSPYFCESSFWASKPKFAAKA